MKSLLCSTILVLAPVAFVAPLSAQGYKGVLKHGKYVDAAHGYEVRVPKKWAEVPTQVDEKWIVAQFQSNREYEGHHKLDNSAFHKPVMRVIMFDEKVIRETKFEEEKAGSGTIRKVKLPYRDYRDYVKRNLSEGGFFFSKEEAGKSGRSEVIRYQVTVEKLSYGGRKTFDAWVYKGEGVQFAIEFEYLTHHYKKLKSSGNRCLKTFKFIEREGVVEDKKLASTAYWLRSDWKKLDAKERHNMRKAIAEQRIKKAILTLPNGWVVKETKNFVILSHASKKYTDRVLKSVECCRQWLEDRVSGVSEEYVSRGIVRICKSSDELQLYAKSSGDAFNPDNREVVDYEDKGAGTSGGGQGRLFYGLYNQYIYDKDEYLFEHIPAWIDYALMDYFASAELKGRSLKFEQTMYEKDAFREMRREDVKPLTAKELMYVTADVLQAGRQGKQHTDAQILRYLRFLEGPGSKHKLFKGKDFILEYMKQTIVQAEDYIEKHPNVRGAGAETEAEEERDANKANEYYKIRRTKICENINNVLCKWTPEEWEDLNDAFQSFCKRQ